MVILNAFAYRSTDPGALYGLDDPIGSYNDQAIQLMVQDAALVICGWGAHGKHLKRGEQVLSLLRESGVTPMALRLNKDGSPGHPLYIPYDQPLMVWN